LISTGPCHTANATIDLLRTVFENRIISRNTQLAALQLRFDSAELFFMGNRPKDECYAIQPETIRELKHEIKVDEIRAHTVENVLKIRL